MEAQLEEKNQELQRVCDLELGQGQGQAGRRLRFCTSADWFLQPPPPPREYLVYGRIWLRSNKTLLLVGAPRTLTVSCHRRWQGEKLVSVSSAAGAPGSPPPRRLLAALTSLSGELHQVQGGPYRRPSDKPEVLAWGAPETRVRHMV